MIVESILHIEEIEHYHNTIINMHVFRNNYLIIPVNKFGAIFVDQNMNITRKLFLFKEIYISDIYIKSDENEIILNCIFANKCIIRINTNDFSYDIINIAEKDHEMWLSKIYYWATDCIILVGNTGFLVKIDLLNKNYQLITKKALHKIDPTFVKFLKHMRKNCKVHPIAVDYGANFFFIKYIDYKRYIYVCRDPEENQNYVIDYVRNDKATLSSWDEEDYVFDYDYNFFSTIQEYKVEVFYNKKSIFKLNASDRVYFSAKLFQDFSNRYLLVLDGCKLTNNNVKITKYILPNVIDNKIKLNLEHE